MKKIIRKLGAVVISSAVALALVPGVALAAGEDVPDIETVPVYGLYNPNSGEHFFTISETEAQGLLQLGWQEGDVKWKAPTEGEAVFRLYNPNVITPNGDRIGDHHFTTNVEERDHLLSIGWKEGDIAFYSAINAASDRVPIYGLYNPNAYAMGKSGAHHLTFNKNEVDYLLSIGWKEGDPKFYGYAVPIKEEPHDVLADGKYSPDTNNCTGNISDDLRMLNINTNWWHYDTSTWNQKEDYPRKEYHIPISEKCNVVEIWGDLPTSRTIYPLSLWADRFNSCLAEGGFPGGIWIVVENGAIVEFDIGG